MPYNPAEHPYPAHRHGPDGAFRVVNNLDEDKQALSEGWATHPSLVGKPPPPAVKAKKSGKAPEKAPAETPLEAALSKAVHAQPDAFDRTVAIATLEAAGYDIDAEVTDAELVEALAELAK